MMSKQRQGMIRLRAAVGTIAVGFFLTGHSAHAQWVVTDPVNIIETTLVDLQQVEAYVQQIQQYETQIQQYENMIQNTARAPFAMIQQARTVVQNLVNSINTLSQLESQFGSLTGYLNRFATLSTYQSNACFQRAGCTGGALNGLQQTNKLASTTQFNAVNASFQNINSQQQQIQVDANNLQTLQTNATGASGQMQALQYGNQLAASIAAQLLQMRALLISEQNMVASINQAGQNTAAQQQASNSQFHTFTPQQPPPNNLTALQWNTF